MNWAWLAGFFDGEGTIRIPSGGGSLNPMFQIVQAGERGRVVLQEIADFLKASGTVEKYTLYVVNSKPRDGGIKSRQPCWSLHVNRRRDVHLILEGLLPFVRVKKTEVQDILRYSKLFPPLRKAKLTPEERLHRRRAQCRAYRARARARAQRLILQMRTDQWIYAS